MHIDALLDVDLVAVESQEQVTVLLELAAPARDESAQRAPSTLQVVLDRSGSMRGGALTAAQEGLDRLLTRLDPSDSFGLVSFDDRVEVTVPTAPLSDKAAVRAAVAGVDPREMTNLSAGYLRGLREARRAAGERGSTLLLLSDGHANGGVLEHDQLERIAREGRAHAVTTSTLGLGLGYDEALLATLSRGGAGDAHFAEHGDDTIAALTEEADHLLALVAQAATLTIRPSQEVPSVTLLNDLAAPAADGGFTVELGDFYAGEQRKLLLAIDVPSLSALGLAQVCELELTWTELPSLDTQSIRLPIHVNVVPGDAAAGRIPNPVVHTERAFQEAQATKQRASDALREGDAAAAAALFRDAGGTLDALAASAPPVTAAELLEEARLLHDLEARATMGDANRTAKLSQADAYRKRRRRGRGDPDPG